jgi:beta-lactamase regulating signal transducer with metallopeptidase domain
MMIGLPSVVAQSIYLLIITLLAPASLRRARWVLRSPRVAIAVWQALSAAWLVSLAMLGLTLAQPELERLAWPDGQPGFTTGQSIIAALGVGLAVATIARAGYVTVRELVLARRRRRSHALALDLAAKPADALGATIIEHHTPAVYSLPAPDRRKTVVVSTGALRVLSDQQLAAVVAHERGHLRHHHHLVIAIAGALSLAFPRVPLLYHAREEIEILAEMDADDHARREHPSDTLADALLALATARTPEPALGAAGHTVTNRLRRMLAARTPLPRPARLAGLTTAAGAVVLPVGLSCTTTFAAIGIVAGRLLS